MSLFARERKRNPPSAKRKSLLSSVGVVDEMLERVLLEAAIQLVGDDVLLAALATIVRREQLKQVRAATGQDDAMSRYLRRADL